MIEVIKTIMGVMYIICVYYIKPFMVIEIIIERLFILFIYVFYTKSFMVNRKIYNVFFFYPEFWIQQNRHQVHGLFVSPDDVMLH